MIQEARRNLSRQKSRNFSSTHLVTIGIFSHCAMYLEKTSAHTRRNSKRSAFLKPIQGFDDSCSAEPELLLRLCNLQKNWAVWPQPASSSAQSQEGDANFCHKIPLLMKNVNGCWWNGKWSQRFFKNRYTQNVIIKCESAHKRPLDIHKEASKKLGNFKINLANFQAIARRVAIGFKSLAFIAHRKTF